MSSPRACALLLAILIAPLNSACAERATLSSPTTRTVHLCGVKFPQTGEIQVKSMPYPETFLTSRVNQERYDACPYEVTIRSHGVPMRLDFSRSTTLADIDSAISSGTELQVGSWYFDGEAWRLDNNVFFPLAVPATMKSIDGGVMITATARRRSIENFNKSSDFCFNLLLVSAGGLVGGMTCAPTEAGLASVQALRLAAFSMDKANSP